MHPGAEDKHLHIPLILGRKSLFLFELSNYKPGIAAIKFRFDFLSLSLVLVFSDGCLNNYEFSPSLNTCLSETKIRSSVGRPMRPPRKKK